MSTKMVKTSDSFTSTPSAKSRMRKTPPMQHTPEESPTTSAPEEVLSRPSSSRLADLYRTDDFITEASNDVRFHVARNLLHLRRYRHLSQAAVAKAVGTSQSAIARIESAQENITLDTLQRIVTALRGRFSITVPPEECAAKPIAAWWEVHNPHPAKAWNVVSYATKQIPGADQVILGLERRNVSIAGGGMLLAESTTGTL